MLTIIIGIPILLNKNESWKIKYKIGVILFCLMFDAVMIYNNLITHL
jgi:hypothetical protein